MSKQSKDPVGRIKTLIESWRTQERDRSFYGPTLPQFEAAVAPVFVVREEGADLAKRVRADFAKRKDVDAAAMGYDRKADRYGGRRRARPSMVASPEGDAKPAEHNA